MKKLIISALLVLMGAILGAGAARVTWESIDKAKNLSDKHLALFLMVNQ